MSLWTSASRNGTGSCIQYHTLQCWQAYSHSPDPIIHGKSNNINKTWLFQSPRPGDMSIRNLTEQVWVSHRNSSNVPWVLYFSNTFELCKFHSDVCQVQNRALFSFGDHHPPSRSAFYPEFRAVEHYFVNGVFAGCATASYSQVTDVHAHGSTREPSQR